MPKFRSVLSTKTGAYVWVPVDDGAKAHRLSEEAMAAGEYKPKPGEEPAEFAKKMAKREAEMAEKGIGLPH